MDDNPSVMILQIIVPKRKRERERSKRERSRWGKSREIGSIEPVHWLRDDVETFYD